MQNNNNNLFQFFWCRTYSEKKKTFINRSSSSALHNSNIMTNIFRIEAYDSVMCGYFCIGFIDFMLAGKTLTEYTNLLPPYNFKKNGSIILIIL